MATQMRNAGSVSKEVVYFVGNTGKTASGEVAYGVYKIIREDAKKLQTDIKELEAAMIRIRPQQEAVKISVEERKISPEEAHKRYEEYQTEINTLRTKVHLRYRMPHNFVTVAGKVYKLGDMMETNQVGLKPVTDGLSSRTFTLF